MRNPHRSGSGVARPERAGIADLHPAFFQKLRDGRVLVLDNHAMIGGEAKRNEFVVDGVHLIGPQGSNDFD